MLKMGVVQVNLSKRETILISVLVFIAIIGVYVFYLFVPKYHKYIDNREKLQQEEQTLDVLQTLETSGQLEKEEKEIKTTWTQIDQAIPSNMNLTTLYSDLLNMRDVTNIKYQTLEFGIADQASDIVVEEGATLANISINMVLSGTYEEVDSYLQSLYEGQRKLVISTISYKIVEEQIEVSLVANGFALVKDGQDQSEEVELIEGKTYGKVNPYK